jgi:hypothetical protein
MEAADRCVADIAVTGGSGGSATGTLTVDLYTLAGATTYTQVRQIMIIAKATQFEPLALLNTTTTFGTATKGSIIASGNGWCLAQTDANGEFDCTPSNSADETIFFEVITAQAFATYAAAGAYGVTVVGSNSDTATWSA